MKTYFIKATLLILMPLVLIACSKDKKEDPNKAKIQDKPWKVSSQSYKDAAGNMSEDVWPQEPDYLKDDITYWASDGSYTISDNVVTRPVNTGPTIDKGTWSIDDGVITMASSSPQVTNQPITIDKVYDKHLEVHFAGNNGNTIYTTYLIAE